MSAPKAPGAPKRGRYLEDPFNDPEPHYIKVEFIETKVYDSGHIENNVGTRVYEIHTGNFMVMQAMTSAFLSRTIAKDLDTIGYVVGVEKKRDSSLVFHQVVLIKKITWDAFYNTRYNSP